MRKIAKYILILLLFAGLVRAAWFGNAIAKLSREKQALQNVVGDFDPAKLDINDFHIMQRPTEDPYHFEWSIQHPTWQLLKANLHYVGKEQLLQQYAVGSFFQGDGSIHRQSLYFEFDLDKIRIHANGMFSQLLTRKFDPELVRALKKNWSRFEIVVFGNEGVETSPGSESVILISVKIPAEVMSELRSSVTKSDLPTLLDGVLFQLGLESKSEGTGRVIL